MPSAPRPRSEHELRLAARLEEYARQNVEQRSEFEARLRERDSEIAALRAELQRSDTELQMARRAKDAMWASRRVLVDEIKSLRARLGDHVGHAYGNGALEQPPPPEYLYEPAPPSPPPRSPHNYLPSARSDLDHAAYVADAAAAAAGSPSMLPSPQPHSPAVARDMEELLDSELAVTQARLKIINQRLTSAIGSPPARSYQ